ncbi:MAG: hypothetical protein ACO395_09705, partial [Pontimonas sp.]
GPRQTHNTQPINAMTTNTTIIEAAESLRIALDAQAEADTAVANAKQHLLDLMIAEGPEFPNTLKVEWGQVQRVTKTEWEFRDRGVTEQNKVVATAKKALAAANKLLKGLEDAAKAAGKAKVVGETTSLRVVRGDKG